MSVCINEYIFVGGKNPRHHQISILQFSALERQPHCQSLNPQIPLSGDLVKAPLKSLIVIVIVPIVAHETILLQKIKSIFTYPNFVKYSTD